MERMFTITLSCMLAGLIGLLALPESTDTPVRPPKSSISGSVPPPEPNFTVPIPAHVVDVPVSPPVFNLGPEGKPEVDAMTASRLDVLLSQMPEHAGWRPMLELEERVREGLPPSAHAEAIRILHAYVAYRQAEAQADANEAAQPAVAGPMASTRRLDVLIALRRQHFGQAQADAMFADQEARARAGILAAQVEAARHLTLAERYARLDALEQSMPVQVATASEDNDGTQASRMLAQQVSALRQQNASEAVISQLRHQVLGAEAAQAFADMEAQQAEWVRRHEEFAQQKALITAVTAGDADRQRAVEALLRRHYSEAEIDNARAYDQAAVRAPDTGS
jgi:lipase chaperone LimK